MEHHELSRTCNLCGSALIDPWFTLHSCRWEGSNIADGFRLHLCRVCYPKIYEPARKAMVELMRQSLLEATAKIKVELQAAGKI